MKIEKESDINDETVKALRESLKLSQKEFWGAVCLTGARGCAYETGRTKPIPPEVRRLVYLHYIIRLPTDIDGKEMRELASIADPARQLRRKMALADDFVDQAKALLDQAKGALDV